MRVRSSARGEPLFALFVVIGSWIGMRVLFWESGWHAPAASAEGAWMAPSDSAAGSFDTGLAGAAETSGEVVPIEDSQGDAMTASYAAGAVRVPSGTTRPQVRDPVRPALARRQRPPQHGRSGLPRSRLVELQALGDFRLAPGTPGNSRTPFAKRSVNTSPRSAAGEVVRQSRWSGDGWLLLRPGASGLLAAGTAPSTYGASQMGAVLRYRFAPDSRYRPAGYLRTSAALDGVERDIALGLSSRFLPWLPIIAQAELRASQQPGKTRLRPAALMVTELPPQTLPAQLRGEAYAQAGYVGGRFATPFIDGQARIDRRVLALGRSELRAGAGLWGGAQRGAARMDLGPSVTFAVPLRGTASARVAVDWRFRVLGNAAPASGPAVTLSAGF